MCSGIEAATVAWHPLGWEPCAFSEIEPFPSAVLAHHYPTVPNLGDMTRYREWPDDLAPDLLVGGTPCQSFSVAGLRRGLADPRGNLALVFLGLVDRYRPRWVVWENVPGVLSSSGGRDFGAFLGGLAELGYGFAYRVLDAQYIRVDGLERAVPQRRRRVFVVGHSGGDWQRCAAVLLERESLSGGDPPRRQAGQGPAPTVSARTRGGGGLGTDFDCDGGLIPAVSPAMKARDSKGPSSDGHGDGLPLIAHSLRAEGFDASEDGTGRGVPLVAQTITADMYRSGGATAGNNPGVRNVLAVDLQQVTSKVNRSRPTPMSPPLTTDSVVVALDNYAVRRLTPVECSRLQGFADSYLEVPYRGKPAADGPRYKALGNSMAVNAMRWIGTRINMVEALDRAGAP